MKQQVYRVVSLVAENIKRLKVVQIDPSGNVIEITGKNGAGKSSLLDSIFFALAGEREIPAAPIRKGQKKAQVTLDLGTLKVTRRFNLQDDGGYTTSLVVETPEGARLQSAQTVLNTLVGELTFDPLAFIRMKAREQFEALKRFVPDFDFDAAARQHDEVFRQRTDVNRDAKRLRAQADGFMIPADVPAEPIDESALVAELQRAGEENAAIAEAAGTVEAAKAKIAGLDRTIQQREERIASLHKQLAEIEMAIADLADSNLIDGLAREDLARKLATRTELPPQVDTMPIRAKIEDARRVNQMVARRKERDTLVQQAAALETKSEELTTRLSEIENDKRKAIATAKMPVEGIGFGNGAITLNDLPFEQASGAEQLRASIAIAMAMNPKLRIILVRDGALLDDDSMKIVHEMAETHGVQVWIETVDSNRPGAVVIEDGTIKAEAE